MLLSMKIIVTSSRGCAIHAHILMTADVFINCMELRLFVTFVHLGYKFVNILTAVIMLPMTIAVADSTGWLFKVCQERFYIFNLLQRYVFYRNPGRTTQVWDIMVGVQQLTMAWSRLLATNTKIYVVI